MKRHDARARARIPLAELLEERIALAVFVVTRADDDINPGSLRRAIMDANLTPAADTITFDPTFFSTPRTITIFSPPTPPQIQQPLTIQGPGASLLTVTRSGPAGRVFDSFASSLTLSGMTISGPNGGGLGVFGIGPDCTLDHMVFTGNVNTGNGGGVFLNNNATLTARDCVFTNNRAAAGGAVFFFQNGSLVMDRCTVSGNAATASDDDSNSGGGVYFSGTARPTPPAGYLPNALVIRNSTIDHNSAAHGGGGIAMDGLAGTLFVQNCTVSDNTAVTSGGGIFGTGGTGTITVQDSTITANTANGSGAGPAGAGGGGIARISSLANALNVVNSVVSRNNSTTSPDIRTDGFTTTTVTSSAVGSNSGFTLAAGSANNLAFGTDPKLGPLAPNGGPTRTHAPLAGSPLLNAGNSTKIFADAGDADSDGNVTEAAPFDQRGTGFARVQGSAVDIGAVEGAAPAPPPRVTGVFVNGSAWTSAFRDYVQGQGLGFAPFGYGVPAGAAQSGDLPWINLTEVSIAFDSPVTVANDDLRLTGINTPTYATDPAAFAYDAAKQVATWRLPAGQIFRKDRLLLSLDASANGVHTPAGLLLDGEWPPAQSAFPSGNGAAGGDFLFRLNVLPGDADRAATTRVTAIDLGFVKARINRAVTDAPNPSGAQYTAYADVNGDAKINAIDLGGVKARLNDTLPPPPPEAVVAELASPSAAPWRPRDLLG